MHLQRQPGGGIHKGRPVTQFNKKPGRLRQRVFLRAKVFFENNVICIQITFKLLLQL